MINISIITTFYNAEKFISESIDSILKQKFDNKKMNIEYLLINDHSKDNSLSIANDKISNYTGKINCKILTTPKNLGCGGARKFGIDNSTGEYLMFLDADDYYIHNDFIWRAGNDIVNTNADIVEYGLVYNKTNGRKMPFHIQNDNEIVNNPEAALLVLFADNLIKFNVWTKIIKRELTQKFQYSTERTFEDVITIPIWVALADKIVIKSSCEINYRVSSKGITMTDGLETRLGTVKAISSHFETFKEYKKILQAMYSRAMIDLEAVLDGKTNKHPKFNEMSKLNRYMLSYIYPETYDKFTDIVNENNI